MLTTPRLPSLLEAEATVVSDLAKKLVIGTDNMASGLVLGDVLRSSSGKRKENYKPWIYRWQE